MMPKLEMIMFQILTVLIAFNKMKGLSMHQTPCTFPPFLHRPLPSGRERHWVTRTAFAADSTTWEKQMIVEVNATTIVKKMRTCGRDDCAYNTVVFRGTCYSVEGYDRYQIQTTGNGLSSEYTCYRFQEINDNAVLVWSSGFYDDTRSSATACSENQLVRDEWVWVAPQLETWEPCPHPGGYDFSAHEHLSGRDLCSGEWRPSRIESECVAGEGMQFHFINPECNFFETKRKVKQLHCWAYWEDDDYSFTLLAEGTLTPHYVLRKPRDFGFHHRQTAFLFFQPIAIKHDNGIPHDDTYSDVHTIQLELTQSESGLCYDESPRCAHLKKQGKCEILEFANYCRKSCGSCKFSPSDVARCRFTATDMMGSWMFFIAPAHIERVTVETGNIRFSGLGNFICKNKHHQEEYYKMLSFYQNGCRPRYTCFELYTNHQELLQFRMSKSDATDRNFRELCTFESEAPPAIQQIDLHSLTSLVPVSKTRLDECGIGGKIEIVSQLHNRRHAHHNNNNKCVGSLSDWNSESCKSESTLKLELNGHCDINSGHSLIYREFTCLAHITIKDGYSILYTNEIANKNRLTCWVIREYAEQMNQRYWRQVHQLDASLCDAGRAIDVATSSREALMALNTTRNGYVPQHPCQTERQKKPSDTSNGGRTLTYNPNGNNRGESVYSAGSTGSTGVRWGLHLRLVEVYLIVLFAVLL